MADKHNLNYDVRELKLGSSFTNNKTSQYHTIKYDFKPASVDVNKMATVDVGTNNQVTVTVPHLDGAGVPQTVFKGNQRPYTKECVLIIDRVTGEITLEKLSSNIQVKKTRQESSSKPRPLTPSIPDYTNTTQRSSSRTRVATNRRTTTPNVDAAGPPPGAGSAAVGGAAGAPRQGAGAGGPGGAAQAAPGPPKPHNMMRSPPRVRTSPPQAAPWSGGGNSTLASLPMIGLDEPAPAAPTPTPSLQRPDRAHERQQLERQHLERQQLERQQLDRQHLERQQLERQHLERQQLDRLVPDRSLDRAPPLPPALPPPTAATEESSSSSSSDSDSDSGSDSDDGRPPALPNGTSANNGGPALPTDVLNDDLCLSESGSDDD